MFFSVRNKRKTHGLQKHDFFGGHVWRNDKRCVTCLFLTSEKKTCLKHTLVKKVCRVLRFHTNQVHLAQTDRNSFWSSRFVVHEADANVCKLATLEFANQTLASPFSGIDVSTQFCHFGQIIKCTSDNGVFNDSMKGNSCLYNTLCAGEPLLGWNMPHWFRWNKAYVYTKTDGFSNIFFANAVIELKQRFPALNRPYQS